MGNVSDGFVGEIKTQVLFSVKLSPENLAVYEIMWINMEGADRPQMAIWHMRIEW
jgi:hypothetical protein